MNDKLFPRHTLCVILHYGSESDTNNCVRSLLNEINLDIVISDNDPAQSYKVPKELKEFVSVIRTGGLAGFSEGNNIGVRAFLSDKHHSIFILNNDTIVAKGALDFLRQTLDGSKVGAVGPCMPYAAMPTHVWACGGYINRISLAVGGLQPMSDVPYDVDYLPGAAILCRAELWKKIGGFNEAYFLAYEEAELCLEVKKLGFKVIADPRSLILHKVGMSSQKKPEYFYNSVRNRLIFSKYLYGDMIGLPYGIFMTMISLKSRKIKYIYSNFTLWSKAIIDHIKGVPINRERFESIAHDFKGFR